MDAVCPVKEDGSLDKSEIYCMKHFHERMEPSVKAGRVYVRDTEAFVGVTRSDLGLEPDDEIPCVLCEGRALGAKLKAFVKAEDLTGEFDIAERKFFWSELEEQATESYGVLGALKKGGFCDFGRFSSQEEAKNVVNYLKRQMREQG